MENLLILVILPANDIIGYLGSQCVGGVFHYSKVRNSLFLTVTLFYALSNFFLKLCGGILCKCIPWRKW